MGRREDLPERDRERKVRICGEMVMTKKLAPKNTQKQTKSMKAKRAKDTRQKEPLVKVAEMK